jgi:RHS repeat-associated protein
MDFSRRLLPFLLMSALGLACSNKRDAVSSGALASVAVSGGGVTVDVIATESWPGGFTGAIRVTNNSFPKPITSFSITFKLGGTASLYGSGSNDTISAPDASGNRTCVSPGWLQYKPIRSGTSWDEGFVGRGTFAGSTIVSVTINGQVIPIGNGGDTTPPSVAIQSNAATVTVPTAITLTATASDDVGVARVDFYDGATLLGSTTFAPYVIAVSLTATDNGTHAYFARAFDAANNSATSSPANVTVDIPPRDTTPPTVYLVSSAVNVTTAGTITLTATAADDVGVARVEFYEGTTLLGTSTSAPYEFPISFISGNTSHTYTAQAVDAAGNSAASAAVIVSVQIQEPDQLSPTIALTSNVTSVTTASTVTLTATAADNVGVARVEFWDGETLLGTRSDAPYELPISFSSADNGTRSYTARAFDAAGNSAISSAVNVTIDIRAADTVSPTVSLAASATSVTTASTVTLIATASDDVGVTRVEFYEGATLLGARASAPYEFGIAFTSADNGVHTYTARAFDAAANSGTSTRTSVTVDIGSGTWVPPDPTAVAPPNDPAVATDIGAATEFLYTGSNPIQVGVPAGTIEPRRVAVVRGQVVARGGAPIEAVTVSVLGHPEFGATRTRADGRFDLAVNGGGVLTIEYQKSGFIPVQRQVLAPWRDYVEADGVVLIPYDERQTEISFGASTLQVARGSQSVDDDGVRQATILFPAGTHATVTLPNGTTASLGTVHVRATEYTVGEDGPRAMPAALPPTSAYTYAVELSIDEAEAVGATNVEFDRPVPLYVENFLGFSVGGRVPTGYYDRAKGLWVPSEDGRVIEILATTGGLAALDTNGDGLADDAATLAVLGISDAERAWLAVTHPVGRSLWRVPLTHFSPWDCNWPFGCDGEECSQPDPDPPSPPDPEPNPECEAGSIIDCNNQGLGESVEVTGTPYRLHYTSKRARGRTAERTTTIPLSGAFVPANVRSLELEIEVAGQYIHRSFPPVPNQLFEFTWDGRDAYGRPMQGTAEASITVGWAYRSVYLQPSARSGNRSFAAMSSGPGAGSVFIPRPTRQDVSLFWRTRKWKVKLQAWDGSAPGLGHWGVNVHHAYDAGGRRLMLGDGRERAALPGLRAISTFAGNGTGAYGGDGFSAARAGIYNPRGIAVGPDGSVFFADYGNHRIRRVTLDGTITTFAGTGVASYSGDGGPATAAQLDYPIDVALGRDGSLFLADHLNNRVRRVAPDGRIATVAGNGTATSGGDGGPATAAGLAYPSGVDLGSDGALYIATSFRIRRVAPDGMITTIAGTGASGYSGDGGPATAATLGSVKDVALGHDGSIYIAESNRVRRVGPDGVISTFAGTGVSGSAGDGGPATAAQLTQPTQLAVGPDGTVYIAEFSAYSGNRGSRVRSVGPDGIIRTVAGTGEVAFSGDGGPAVSAALYSPHGVAIGSDRTVFVSDSYNNRVRVITPLLLGWNADDFWVASEDGGEVYHFEASGKHLRTLDAATKVELYSFDYDDAGRLSSVRDRNGLVTRIERSSSGAPVAIVAPYGQQTILASDANGYLNFVANPASESRRYTYDPTGLMLTYEDPRGGVHVFQHDSMGRLVRDANPAGGWKELARNQYSDGYTVSVTTALGRSTLHRSKTLSTGDQLRTATSRDGTSAVTTLSMSGTDTRVAADGTVMTIARARDPRFGLVAPMVSTTVRTPGGKTLVLSEGRSATLSDPGDPVSATLLGGSLSLNGRVYSSTFDAVTRTVTARTPSGRVMGSVLDDRGRLSALRLPGTAQVDISYDAEGRPQTMTQGLRSYTFGYDAGGALQRVTDPLGRMVVFTRDAAGRITRQALPGDRTVLYAYDANGNPTSVSPPGRPAHGFQYTPADLTGSYVPPRGAGVDAPETNYTYDRDGALTQVVLPGNAEIVSAYDFAGRLESLVTSRGTSTLGYDAAGRLKTITFPDGVLAYAYDGPLLKSESTAGPFAGLVEWTYDDDFRVSATTVNGSSISYTYDSDTLLSSAGQLLVARESSTGRVSGTSLGVVGTADDYNEYGEPSTFSARAAGSDLFSYTFTRDLVGRITSKNETAQGVTTTYAYGYDDAGRLQAVIRNGTLVAGYAYDANGNRLSASMVGGHATGRYDDQDRLLSYGETTFTYRPNGELQSKTTAAQTTWYDYDALGNLRGVILPDGRQLEYVIDGRNRRVGKRVNGSLVEGFLYEGKLRPVAWLNGDGQVYARFVYGLHVNVPEYMVTASGTFRFITDHLGSPRLVVNAATGAVAQRIDYDEWGQVLTDSNPGFQPFGFAGGLYDADTGLVRFGARDYDPTLGRWTTKDPVRFLGGLNLYLYCEGDPVNDTDPRGLVAGAVLGPILGKLMGKTAQEVAVASRMGDALTSPILEAAGLGLDSSRLDVGLMLDGLKAYSGYSSLSLAYVLATGTSVAAGWPLLLSLLGGWEIGSALDRAYTRVRGRTLGDDVYYWLHPPPCYGSRRRPRHRRPPLSVTRRRSLRTSRARQGNAGRVAPAEGSASGSVGLTAEGHAHEP